MLQKQLRDVGLSLQASKCEVLCPNHRPAPQEQAHPLITSFRRPPVIRLLGAYIGQPEAVSKEVSAKILEIAGIAAGALTKVQSDDPLAVAVLLSDCLLSRVTYLARTNPPIYTKAPLAQFDDIVIKLWSEMAEVDATATAQDTAAIPTAEGGLGFQQMCPRAEEQYAASREARDTKKHDYSALLQFLKGDENTAAHLTECAETATSSWLRHYPRGFTSTQARAALRIRLNTPHRQLQTTVVCPGCSIRLSPSETIPHLRGCAKIRGLNCSHSHGGLSKDFGRLLSELGIHHEVGEPREYCVRYCSDCRVYVLASLAEAHCEAAGCSPEELSNARLTGPDKRIHFTDGSCVIDFTMIGTASRAYCKDAEAAIKRRESAKDKRYRSAVEEGGEAFITIAATPNGFLSDATRSLAQKMASESQGRMTVKEIEDAVRAMVIKHSANALINAERQLGVHHTSRPARIPTVDQARTAHDEAIAAQQAQRARQAVAPSGEVATTSPKQTRPLPSAPYLRRGAGNLAFNFERRVRDMNSSLASRCPSMFVSNEVILRASRLDISDPSNNQIWHAIQHDNAPLTVLPRRARANLLRSFGPALTNINLTNNEIVMQHLPSTPTRPAGFCVSVSPFRPSVDPLLFDISPMPAPAPKSRSPAQHTAIVASSSLPHKTSNVPSAREPSLVAPRSAIPTLSCNPHLQHPRPADTVPAPPLSGQPRPPALVSDRHLPPPGARPLPLTRSESPPYKTPSASPPAAAPPDVDENVLQRDAQRSLDRAPSVSQVPRPVLNQGPRSPDDLLQVYFGIDHDIRRFPLDKIWLYMKRGDMIATTFRTNPHSHYVTYHGKVMHLHWKTCNAGVEYQVKDSNTGRMEARNYKLPPKANTTDLRDIWSVVVTKPVEGRTQIVRIAHNYTK